MYRVRRLPGREHLSRKRVSQALATNMGRMRICLTLELIPSFRLIRRAESPASSIAGVVASPAVCWLRAAFLFYSRTATLFRSGGSVAPLSACATGLQVVAALEGWRSCWACGGNHFRGDPAGKATC